MSLQSISRDIFSKANDEKKLVEEELEKQIKALESETEERITNYSNNLKNHFDSEIHLSEISILGEYKKQANKKVLDSKSNLLKRVYEKSLSKILNLDDKSREKILSSLLKKAKSLIDYDTVYVNKKDKSFIQGKVSSNIKVVTKSDLNGLIFETKDKTQILDLSLELVLDEVFSESEEELRNVLAL